MQPYNVEVFDRDFNFIHNYTIEEFEYNEDYLTLPETTIFMSYNPNVTRGCYITVFNSKERYSGVITTVTISANYNGYMNVGFKSFIAMLNASRFLDVAYINTYAQTHSLESYIYENIKHLYIDGLTYNGEVYGDIDTDLIIPGLEISLISNTLNWSIGLYRQSEGDLIDYQKVSYIDDLIIPAMKIYQIGCYVEFDFKLKKIKMKIGKKTNTPIVVETSLPNVYNTVLAQKDTANDVNTVDLAMTVSDETWNFTWYKNIYGEWSGDIEDRSLPVVYDQMEIQGYNMQTGQIGQSVYDMLVEHYGGSNKDNNSVELTVNNDDPLATMFNLGDSAEIIINDTVYTSIYTGKTKAKTTTLIFGTQRMDLTKILKRRI